MPGDMVNNLSSAGYLVRQDSDAEAVRLLRYMKLSKSFQTERLSLVIAPTLYCNFACPYCYEKDLPNWQMKDDVVDGIIDFIKQREEKFKFLEICWHGGEPLVAINVIEKILGRIKNETKLELKEHSIVTNGSLFSEKVFDCFSKFPLGYVQITIDGNEQTHNLNRISKNGKATFETIVHNIDLLTEKFPKTKSGYE